MSGIKRWQGVCREISAVLHELIIKEDLKNRKISLFDWKSLDFEKAFSFGVPFSTEDGIGTSSLPFSQTDGLK